MFKLCISAQPLFINTPSGRQITKRKSNERSCSFLPCTSHRSLSLHHRTMQVHPHSPTIPLYSHPHNHSTLRHILHFQLHLHRLHHPPFHYFPHPPHLHPPTNPSLFLTQPRNPLVPCPPPQQPSHPPNPTFPLPNPHPPCPHRRHLILPIYFRCFTTQPPLLPFRPSKCFTPRCFSLPQHTP